MGKSRHSKNKSNALLCGMNRYKDLKFSQGGGVVMAENRQMRRMRKK
jgi:hypothetical protein